MTWQAIIDETGELRSVASITSDVLPDGWTAADIDDTTAERYRAGEIRWGFKGFEDVPPPPDPAIELVDTLVAQGVIDAGKKSDAVTKVSDYFDNKGITEAAAIASP